MRFILQHELYRSQQIPYYCYDIVILTLASPIYANGVTIQYAKLPENNDDLFTGQAGYITGWGRTGELTNTVCICSGTLPLLQVKLNKRESNWRKL
jgi:hypothetical protein